MSKQDLAQALFDAIPVELRDKYNVTFGEVSSITEPDDVDSAIIAMGKVTVQMWTLFFGPLSKFPFTQALLYLGSLNPAVIASVFSGLESLSGGGGSIEVIAPKNGGVYPGFFDAWTVKAEAESVTVSVGEDSFSMTRNDDIWSAKWPVPIGAHTATITDGSESVTVSFSVVSWDVYPPEGGSVSPGDIEISITPEGDQSISTVIASVDGQNLTLENDGGTWKAILVDTIAGSFQTVYKVSLADNIIDFAVNWVCE